MRVGVYVDGYNLYYGGRGICGRGTAGWRWLDIRSLAHSVIAAHSGWTGPFDLRIVYCTARIKGAGNSSGQYDQDTYLRALKAAGAVDVIEYGSYQTRIKTNPLAVRGKGNRPVLATSKWPIMVRDQTEAEIPDATFLVSVARREEKGSDVNVATHLMADALCSVVEAAVVVSNDSDLKLPVQKARMHVPVGVVNPTMSFVAGAFNAPPTVGAGRHWWYQLSATDFTSSQLPSQVKHLRKPTGW